MTNKNQKTEAKTGKKTEVKLGRIVHFASGKGGSGCSTIALNIAAGIALLGHKTIIVDTDIGKNSLDIMLGLENQVKGDLIRLLEGSVEPEQVFIQHPVIENLVLLPAPSDYLPKDLKARLVPLLFQILKEQYNFIIVDCPTSIDYGFFSAITSSDKFVMVTAPDQLSIRNTDRVIGILEDQGISEDNISFILNKYNHELFLDGYIDSDKDIQKILKVKSIGTIPYSEELFISYCSKNPVIFNQDSKLAKLLLELSRVFTGEAPDVDFISRDGFFKKIFSLFKTS